MIAVPRRLSLPNTPAGFLVLLARALVVPAAILLVASDGGFANDTQGILVLTIFCIAALFVLPTSPGDLAVWALFIVGLAVFTDLRRDADELGIMPHFGYPIAIDKILGFGTLPTVRLQGLLFKEGSLPLYDVGFLVVYTSYFVAPNVVAVLLWRFWREQFSRFFVALLLTVYVALVLQALVPTAPPWLATQEGHIEGVVKVTPHIAGHLKPGSYEAGQRLAGSNDVAAMPSLHFAIPVLIALVALKVNRVLGALGAAYVMAMGFTLVYLGEHYIIDELGGLALAVGAWWLAPRVLTLKRTSTRTQTHNVVEVAASADSPSPSRGGLG